LNDYNSILRYFINLILIPKLLMSLDEKFIPFDCMRWSCLFKKSWIIWLSEEIWNVIVIFRMTKMLDQNFLKIFHLGLFGPNPTTRDIVWNDIWTISKIDSVPRYVYESYNFLYEKKYYILPDWLSRISSSTRLHFCLDIALLETIREVLFMKLSNLFSNCYITNSYFIIVHLY
jgi:hypothetical protein